MYAAKYPQRVKKIILVGSGPFEVKYVSEIAINRIKHLSDAERAEFDELLKRLNSGKEIEKGRLLERLGALVNKSDNYCAFKIDTVLKAEDLKKRVEAERLKRINYSIAKGEQDEV